MVASVDLEIWDDSSRPSIHSNGGGPSARVRPSLRLVVKARPRTDASWNTFSCSFALEAGTTSGQLLEPFHFCKLDAAYLGCRDGMWVLFYFIPCFPFR